MTSYPYKAAKYDYGPRAGTLGLDVHMSEGYDTGLAYLANNPARGVSANFFLMSTGAMWQMLPLGHASGSLNPKDRATEKGYYGHSVLVDVLGDHWTDPNTWSISVEMSGFARKGPNLAQVAALGNWAADMRDHFPTLRGAFGHADQTDTKQCPGLTPSMRAGFAAMGGHGLWKSNTPEAPVRTFIVNPGAKAGTFTVAEGGHYYLRLADDTLHEITAVPFAKTPSFGPVTLTDTIDHRPGGADRKVGYLVGSEAAVILAVDGAFVPATTPVGNCDPAVNAALDHVQPAAQAVLTAINEARPR